MRQGFVPSFEDFMIVMRYQPGFTTDDDNVRPAPAPPTARVSTGVHVPILAPRPPLQAPAAPLVPTPPTPTHTHTLTGPFHDGGGAVRRAQGALHAYAAPSPTQPLTQRHLCGLWCA